MDLANPAAGGRSEIQVHTLLDHALQRLQENAELDDSTRKSLLLSIAKRYHQHGIYQTAIELLERAENLPTTADNRDIHNQILWYKARTHHFYGRYDEADQMYRDLIDLKRAQPDSPGMYSLAYIINKYGCMKHSHGEYVAAESLILEAIKEYNNSPTEVTYNLSVTYRDIADLYKDWQRFDQALTYYNKALTALSIVPNTYDMDRSLILDELGHLYVLLNEPEKAYPLIQEAITIRTPMFSLDNAVFGNSFHHLAAYYVTQNDFQQAFMYDERAIQIYEDNLSFNHMFLLRAKTQYAEHLLLNNQIQKASEIMQPILSVLQDSQQTRHPFAARMYLVAAIVANLQNNTEQSQQHVQMAMDLWKHHFPHRNIRELSVTHLASIDFWSNNAVTLNQNHQQK